MYVKVAFEFILCVTFVALLFQIKLRGPSTPYELSFYNLTANGRVRYLGLNYCSFLLYLSQRPLI